MRNHKELSSMNIPSRIDTIDARIKNIIIYCYVHRENRRKCFGQIIHACATEELRREFKNLWSNVEHLLAEGKLNIDYSVEYGLPDLRPEHNKKPKNTSNDIVSTKTVQQKAYKIVPWETIDFHDRFIRFHDFSFDKYKSLKVEEGYYSYSCKDSRASYNIVKPHLQQRLPQIKAYMEGRRVTQLVSDVNLNEALRILEAENNAENVIVDESPMISPSGFRTAFNEEQLKVVGRIRAARSRYFDKLITMSGVDQYRIVPCQEVLSHPTNRLPHIEDAFMFSHDSAFENLVILIFENVNDARATIKFYAVKEKYEQALKCVFDFMGSYKHNKRQLLKWHRVDFRSYGIVKYECINHTYVDDWYYRL